MPENFSRYRLNEDAELDVYRRDLHKFVRFQAKVYNMLDGVPVRGTINVCDIVVPESLDVFIKVVCMYILLHQRDDESASRIEFSEDYRKIYRRPGFIRPNHLDNHFYAKR